MSPLLPGSDAPNVELETTAGASVWLSSFWQKGKLALFFERHLGWPLCREHVVYVRNDYAKFQSLNAEVVVVTQGPAAAAKQFSARQGLPFPVLADTRRLAYQAYGVPRGSLAAVAGPSMWVRGFQALMNRGVGAVVGDAYQMPGAFIIDGQGRVHLAHYAKNSGDWPANEALFAILKQCN